MKRLLLAALLAIGLALAGATSWLALRDPLAALPRAEGPLNAVPERPERRNGRLIQHYVLRGSTVGPIGFAVDLPDPLPDRPLPVLVVVGGLASGAQNLRQIPPSGANAFVGYDWPLLRKPPKGLDLLREGPGLYRRVRVVPGQIAAILGWLDGQSWADAQRISLLGFSLGALVAPAAQRLAQSRGHAVGWTVLAYGGADLGRIVAEHPKVALGPAKPLLRIAANLLLRPIEPGKHLPHLSGRFLVIGGATDRLIPRPSAEHMRQLTPEPKTVLLLEGAHIGTGTGQQALLEDIVRRTGTWLLEQGAVNPP